MRDLLRIEILDSRYGSMQLPAEPELMLEYAVGRNVVREALDLLRAEGLIERIQGSGTFVLATKAEHRLDRVHSIHDSVPEDGRVSGQISALATVIAPRPVAAQLLLPAHSTCVLVEYTATISGTPFSVSTSYLPLAVAERIAETDFAGDFYLLLELMGFAPARAEQRIEAILADEHAALALDVAPGAPLLMFTRKLFAADNAPLEVGFIRCRGDRFSLQIALPRSVTELR